MSENAERSPLVFDEDGLPRSRRYGDVYFSREGGLAETRAVFLAGCGLPERWTGRRRFTVGELGFGTGLNVLALLDLWRTHRPPGGRLSIFSVEAEPIPAADARRALSAWPELADLSDLLLARWPGRRPGFHRVDLPELGATLDLAVVDAEAALQAWDGAADAWFLDGFAPAVNPGMWTDALMALVARRSAPGAHAATYTIAGQARRALAAAGFDVQRRPGFGAKRERLEASLPGAAVDGAPAPRIAIVGAGIAGASLARAFRVLGAEPRIFEAERLGAGASGNPAALVTPHLDAALGPAARLSAQAFHRACQLYEAIDGAVIARGMLQFEATPRDAGRFAKIAASDVFERGTLALLSAEAASEIMGEAVPAGLTIPAALVIDPAVVLSAWAGALDVATVARLELHEGGWRLIGEAGAVLAEADVVCLAPGADLARLWPAAPIQPVRGQLNWSPGPAAPAAVWGTYVAPMRGGLMFGATNDRGDATMERREADDRRNLEALAQRLPRLAARLAGAPISGRASVRAATPDRLPIAGLAQPGLFVLGGLGSRGFSLAPLLAEHIAAVALGAPSPLPHTLAPIVGFGRFALRAAARA